MKGSFNSISELFSDPVMIAVAIGVVVLLVIAILSKVLFERNVNKNLAESGADMDKIKAANKKKAKKTLLYVAIVLAAIIITGFATGGNSSVSKNVCPSCDRKYTDSANKKSISKTNMCKNCYGNYKSLEWVLDE